MEPRALAQQAITALQRHADPARAESVQRYFRETVHSLGVPVPTVRRLEKELFAQVRGAWDVQEALELCEVLLLNHLLEVKALGLITLARFANRLGPDAFDRCEAWLVIGYCANWGATDQLCPHVVAPILTRHPDLLPRLVAWTASPNRWLRRGSAVTFVPLASRGVYLDTAYTIAERLLPDKDDLVQKGAGWLLRQCGKADPVRLEAWLRRWGSRVPRTTLRYAIERFPLERRQELLAVTRPGHSRR